MGACTALATAGTLAAETSPPVATPSVETPAAVEAPVAPAFDPIVAEVRRLLDASPAANDVREENDTAALKDFYATRQGAPLWIADGKLNGNAEALINTFATASDYGLDPSAFATPPNKDGSFSATTLEERATAELTLSRAALLYARHARGGRIPEPAEMLNTNLDRKPQLLDPKTVFEGLASATDVSAYMAGLHPKHPQFEKLRQAYLATLPADRKGPLSAAAKRIRANMEMWRWMWDDLGELHVFNNIPEFMQRVYRNGEVIRSEKIVAGMIDKQSSVFSRPLKYVALRPTWRVPESIKVHELWPSLIRGGGYMRQYGLVLQTKDGRTVDWRTIDWTKADIREYDVIQPPGPKSVLGKVKFSFPSQHTIFMHDTPDRWMFRSGQRTLSHGCLRIDKPMDLAEIVLKEDKGWDADKIAEISRSGPLNNEIEIEKKIPIHLAYFTAWVDDDGKLKMFRDVYGHEKRVTQALDGQWNKINKGRDHLAPVHPGFSPEAVARSTPAQKKGREMTVGDMIGNALGLSF